MTQQELLFRWRENNLLDEGEAASLLGVSLKTYRSWESGGSMKIYAINLILALGLLNGDDIKKYKLARNKVKEELMK